MRPSPMSPLRAASPRSQAVLVEQPARRSASDGADHPALSAMVEPRRLLRWVYIGRLSVAIAIFAAAVTVWTRADTDTNKLLVASLAFALTTGATVLSAGY